MSLLSIPRSTSGSKRNSARLDVLTLMTSAPAVGPSSLRSPRDSLSPLDERAKDDLHERGRTAVRRALEIARVDDPNDKEAKAGTRAAQTQQPFLDSLSKHEVATDQTWTAACSPRCLSLITRERRPANLKLTRSNGSTSLPIDELKNQICNGHTNTRAAITEQVPRRKPIPRPQPQPSDMGNKPSSIAGSPEPDDASTRSVIRRPARMLRRSSQNLLKRLDSKSPLPREFTATAVLQVTQQVSPTTFDGSNGNEIDDSPIDPFLDGHALSPTSEREDKMPEGMQSPSTNTITNEGALRPLSASTTIRDARVDSQPGSRGETRTSFVEDVTPKKYEKHRSSTAPPPNCSLTLSPTIPAPSPLPEDSPHKYGLKDRMDTPDIPEPEKVDVVKARRRSTGVDIFNEAKSLQSASSFLNGLSTSRRRAESTQRSTDASAWTNDTSRPSSSRFPSRPSSAAPPANYLSDRRHQGHAFKPSGFAYTRPLTVTQMKCYRHHSRLMPSRNENAPVECAVCHVDDDHEHFSCSWCALRMCRFCSDDFAERGVVALKQRIKRVELGGDGSSSEESLAGVGVGRRKMKKAYV